jgi:hypothetical protein
MTLHYMALDGSVHNPFKEAVKIDVTRGLSIRDMHGGYTGAERLLGQERGKKRWSRYCAQRSFAFH